MSAAWAWFTTVVLVVCGVIVMHQLGIDITPGIASAIHGIERLFAQPI